MADRQVSGTPSPQLCLAPMDVVKSNFRSECELRLRSRPAPFPPNENFGAGALDRDVLSMADSGLQRGCDLRRPPEFSDGPTARSPRDGFRRRVAPFAINQPRIMLWRPLNSYLLFFLILSHS